MFLDDKTGTYVMEARTQANRPGTCLCCGEGFKQDADKGVYGLTFCASCIKGAKGKMPKINYPANPAPEPVRRNPTEY